MDIANIITTILVGIVMPSIAVVANLRAQVLSLRESSTRHKRDIRHVHKRIDDHIADHEKHDNVGVKYECHHH